LIGKRAGWALLAGLQLLACTAEDPAPGNLEPMAVSRPSPKKPTPVPTATATPRPAPPSVVFVLRHAEKSAKGGNDPDLSPAGKARAKLLVSMFGKTGITAVYASQFVRTQQTVGPLAEKLGLPVQVVLASDLDALVQQVLANSGGKVLVVAHSDSAVSVIEKLGAGRLEAIDESDFDNLYIVTFDAQGQAQVVSMQYGPPT
jgi:broad specificity phosphatase PhoE